MTWLRIDCCPVTRFMVTASFREFLDGVNYGGTALFLEGCGKVLLVETKGWEHRTVDRPQSEQTVNGPQEAFTETLRTNTALLRKLLKSEQLSTELLTVGSRIKTFVAVMYLRDLANPALVDEVKGALRASRWIILQTAASWSSSSRTTRTI